MVWPCSSETTPRALTGLEKGLGSTGEATLEIAKRSCDNLTRKGLMKAVGSIQDFHRTRSEDDMKVENPVRSSPPVWSLTAALLTAVLLVALAAACGGNDEESPASAGTPAAAGSPAATTPAAAAPGISDSEILLGAEVILSGSMGAVYATIPNATNAYFKYINETEGGVCGRKIVYQYEDNKDDPAVAVEVARKLVEQDKVFAMVGSLGDSPHPASWEYLNEKGVPDILASAGAHRFGADAENHPWTVQMIPSYYVEGVLFGKYISENLPGKTVAVLHGDEVGGIDAMNGLKDGLDPSKNEIVGEEIADYAAISINSQIANLKKSNADIMVAFSSPGFAAQAIKVADRMGWDPQWFIEYTSADDMMFAVRIPQASGGRHHLPGPQDGGLARRPGGRQALRDHAEVRRACPQQLHHLRSGARRDRGRDPEQDLR